MTKKRCVSYKSKCEKKVFFKNSRDKKPSLAYKFRFTIKIITAEQNDKLLKLYIKTVPAKQIYLFVTIRYKIICFNHRHAQRCDKNDDSFRMILQNFVQYKSFFSIKTLFVTSFEYDCHRKWKFL